MGLLKTKPQSQQVQLWLCRPICPSSQWMMKTLLSLMTIVLSKKKSLLLTTTSLTACHFVKLTPQIHSSELKVYLACSPPGRVKTKFITEILHKNNNNYNKKKQKKICNKKNNLAV